MEAKEQDLKSEFTIEVNNVLKGIVSIAEQNKEKRGLIVIAVDDTNSEKVEVIGSLGGNRDLLIAALSNLIQEDKRLKRLFEKALIRAKIDSMMDELLSGLSDCMENDKCANCDKKAECDLINNKENKN
jgi:hypothetical protein